MFPCPAQVKELEQSLQVSEEKLKQSSNLVVAQEAQILELVRGAGGLRVLGPSCFSFRPCPMPGLTSMSDPGCTCVAYR